MFDVLRKAIFDTFPRLPATKYRLSDAIIEDDYGDKSYTFEEKWETWDEIENWQVVKCEVLFCYAPLEAAAYLIPRYMLFFLDETEGNIPSQFQGYVAGESAIWHLQRLKKSHYKNSGLTKSQIETVEMFLSEMQQNYY